MHGHAEQYAKGLGPENFSIGFSFQTTTTPGALDATAQSFRKATGWSGRFSVSYAATGIYTITLPTGMILPSQPHSISVDPQAATLATDWFECLVIGETTLNATTKQIVVQCHRNGTAQAPANTAGNRINVTLCFQNNTGG